MCDLTISGVHVYSFEPHRDPRGSWTRVFDLDSTCQIDLPNFVQMSFSYNKSSGTFRGMHLMAESSKEWKFVSVSSGKIHDFLLDTRRGSSTFGFAMRISLSLEGFRSILIPPGVAHGFLTSEDDTTLLYAMTAKFNEDLEFGYSWKTPAVMNLLEGEPHVISKKDMSLPVFDLGIDR